MIADRVPGIRQGAGLDVMKHHIKNEKEDSLGKNKKAGCPVPHGIYLPASGTNSEYHP